ncbi:MAG TPA: nuclear transport factor 2 family protein [Gemmatimonas sp.]|uniref:nuclear transport factor 2 family protein n=1 Tax=Gemmatimonas sp. TaxID=1962908 RepID=UPI002ED84882
MAIFSQRLAIFGMLAMILVAVPGRAQAPTEARKVEATIRAAFAAAERGDMAALDTLYAGDSLTVFEGAGVNNGWTDYRDNHLGPELKEMKEFRYRPIAIQAHVSGNLAWATVQYALSAQMNGRSIDNFGRGTVILEKRGARWVVRHTHTASRARRPSDPPMPPSNGR